MNELQTIQSRIIEVRVAIQCLIVTIKRMKVLMAERKQDQA